MRVIVTKALSHFNHPHLAVIVTIAAVTAILVALHPGADHIGKASFLFSSALGHGYLMMSALAMRTGAQNMSVLLCLLGIGIISAIIVGTDAESLKNIDPLEGLLSGAAGAIIAIIGITLEQHMVDIRAKSKQ